MGNFYVRCEEQGAPLMMPRDENEIHSQLFYNLQEYMYPFEANDVAI